MDPTQSRGQWTPGPCFVLTREIKPLGIKSPTAPIKTLGVLSTYDPEKLSHLKNLAENIDNIKKLITIWPSRGVSIYGKITLIKSLFIPKIVYTSSLLPTPEHIVKDLKITYYISFYGKAKIK